MHKVDNLIFLRVEEKVWNIIISPAWFHIERQTKPSIETLIHKDVLVAVSDIIRAQVRDIIVDQMNDWNYKRNEH